MAKRPQVAVGGAPTAGPVSSLIQNEDQTPENTSAQYNVMAPHWELVNTLLGGTKAMREAGEKLLPRHPEESDNTYKRRREQAVLVNAFEMTVETLTGRPFSEPIRLESDVPPRLRDFAENIDLQGNHLDVFARRWFRDALAKGYSHVLVEFPRRKERPDGQPRTLADDRAEGLRPYWLHIQPEDLLAAYVEEVNGSQVLSHIRFRELTIVREGFEEKLVERIHVREPGRFEVWEKQRQGKQDKYVWVKIDEGVIDLDFIPLVTFYTARSGFMLCKPPLLDLAYLNVCHWQSYSDQRNILSVSRFPMLAGSGVDEAAGEAEGTVVKVGPNQVLMASDPQAKFYYVEINGNSIEQGRKDLEGLLAEMAAYGAEFLKKQAVAQVATGRALDQKTMLSPLQAMAISFKDAMELALEYTAAWIKEASGGSVWVNMDYGPEGFESADLAELGNARARGDISRKQWVREMQRRNLVADDYDAEGDIAQIKKEAEELPKPQDKVPEPNPRGGAGNGGTPPAQKPGVNPAA